MPVTIPATDSDRSYGIAVLAWCQEHPAEVDTHTGLVAQLRHALAVGAPIAAILVALRCEVPGTARIGE